MKTFVFMWMVDECNAVVLLWAEDVQLWKVLRVITDDGEPFDKNPPTIDVPILSTEHFAEAWQTAAVMGGNYDEPDVYEVEETCNRPLHYLN